MIGTIIYDCEQGSEEWFKVRLGIPTASEFSTVMAQGKTKGSPSITRRKYMLKLAAERITGRPEETYTNAWMERGKEQEDEAREAYAFGNGVQLKRVGFIHDVERHAGCSPDSLVSVPLERDPFLDRIEGGLEIKTCLGSILLDRILRGGLPPEHKDQIQGTIWLCNAEWWDLFMYCPGLPPFQFREYRDQPFIDELAAGVSRFNEELEEVVYAINQQGSITDALKASLGMRA